MLFEIDSPDFYKIETNVVVSHKAKKVLWQNTFYINGKSVSEEAFAKAVLKIPGVVKTSSGFTYLKQSE